MHSLVLGLLLDRGEQTIDQLRTAIEFAGWEGSDLVIALRDLAAAGNIIKDDITYSLTELGRRQALVLRA